MAATRQSGFDLRRYPYLLMADCVERPFGGEAIEEVGEESLSAN
jgi:hypothetical protein